LSREIEQQQSKMLQLSGWVSSTRFRTVFDDPRITEKIHISLMTPVWCLALLHMKAKGLRLPNGPQGSRAMRKATPRRIWWTIARANRR
jgi:hypothetical protein